jgi:Ca-activated chloride channel family protein
MLQTSGGTEIFKGLEAGYNEVFRLLRKDRINHIIMLTDGRTYGDEADCMHIAEQAANYGVGISALGIGSKWNDAFLDSLASVTGGSSVYVSKPKDLQDYLKGKFSGLGKSFVDRVTFSFEFGVGVEMRYAFRLQPDAAQLPFESPIQLGSIPLESTLGILMEFFVASVPPGLNIITLLDGHITVDIPTRNIPSHTLRSRLNRPTSVSPDLGAPPMAIMQAMSKITLFRMQERAQEDLATGNIEEATHRLQNIATHLLAQGERELADAVLEEAKHILQYQKISEEGKKRIKYGTRDLMLPSPHRSKILDDSTKEHFASEVGKGAGE